MILQVAIETLTLTRLFHTRDFVDGLSRHRGLAKTSIS